MFVLTGLFLFFAILVGIGGIFAPLEKGPKSMLRFASGICVVLAGLCFGGAGVASVGPSQVGIVTSFGQIEPKTLNAGIHLIRPWADVTQVYLGQQTAEIQKSEASSKDLQSVHADLVTNFSVVDARSLFAINTTLNYPDLIVAPAIQEVFKAVVARYTAEELVTKRQEVSVAITQALSERLAPYYLKVQTVNLTNFGFSESFNQAIEQKVTASQQAETAKRNLDRVQFEAQARVEQAKGEAEAIRIQSEAVQKNGGDAYVHLQAIQKWDGKLPQYVSDKAAMPFIGVN